jgi:opacity protein-like surface antigen
MKITRISFAAVLVLAAAACSADVTAPEPAQLAPAAASQTESAADPGTTASGSESSPDGGLLGSTGG